MEICKKKTGEEQRARNQYGATQEIQVVDSAEGKKGLKRDRRKFGGGTGKDNKKQIKSRRARPAHNTRGQGRHVVIGGSTAVLLKRGSAEFASEVHNTPKTKMKCDRPMAGTRGLVERAARKKEKFNCANRRKAVVRRAAKGAKSRLSVGAGARK